MFSVGKDFMKPAASRLRAAGLQYDAKRIYTVLMQVSRTSKAFGGRQLVLSMSCRKTCAFISKKKTKNCHCAESWRCDCGSGGSSPVVER